MFHMVKYGAHTMRVNAKPILVAALLIGLVATFSGCTASDLLGSQKTAEQVSAITSPAPVVNPESSDKIVTTYRPLVQTIASTIPYGNSIDAIIAALAGVLGIAIQTVRKSNSEKSLNAAINNITATHTLDVNKLHPQTVLAIAKAKAT